MRSRILAVVLAFAASGCSVTRYNVQLNTFTAPTPRFEAGTSTVAILAQAEDANPLFTQEVEGKVALLLRQQGFKVVPPAQADVLVFALFGLGAPSTEVQTVPLYTPGGTTVTKQGRVTVIGQEKGSWTYYSQAHTAQNRWLTLRVADAQAFHAKELDAKSIKWLWIADVVSAGRSSDLRRVIDYMLVPAMEWFGRSTGGVIHMSLRQDDGRVARLRTSAGSR